jgi:hypothetical protein
MSPEFTLIAMTNPATPAPLICDMTTAPDTPQERMAEYGRLFEHALIGRDRTANAVVWRFTARPDVEAWVRDLADREAACCPFLDYTVTDHHGQITYRIAGDDDPIVQAILDEVHNLPDQIESGAADLLDRLETAGLDIHTDETGSTISAP